MEMWYTIVLYYASVGRERCLRYTFSTPALVHRSNGGYTHTIRPIERGELLKKPLV